jgi:hypothetical protein
MDKPDRRQILSRVAAGTITPEDAAAQLDSLDQSEEQADRGIRKIRVERQLGSLELLGDPTVRDAVAQGPHVAHLDGDVMVFEGQASDEPGRFFFGLGRHLDDETLVIRVNPSLAVDVEVQAGSCRIRGVEGPIRAEVQAGSAKIEGFKNSLNLSVQAGSVKAAGRLDEGESHISCDAGSVSLQLESGSSVRISAQATMGKIELPNGISVTGGRRAEHVVVGDGLASLVINSNMGSVKVSANQ